VTCGLSTYRSCTAPEHIAKPNRAIFVKNSTELAEKLLLRGIFKTLYAQAPYPAYCFDLDWYRHLGA
jgi:hypothetical protein